MNGSCTLAIQFSAAHFYAKNNWSAEKNLQTFGKCYSAHGHGHDYRLEVAFTDGTVEKLGLPNLQSALEVLAQRLDHRHLNFEIDIFKQEQIPTSENIAWWCADFLRQQLPQAEIKILRIFERSDLFVEIYP